jgi:DNA polymerase-3 subunit epsilon
MAIELQRYTPRPDEQCGIAAFIDVETTGLSTRFDEVVEFAIALFAFDRTTGQIKGIIDEYVGLRDPGRPIPADARRVHRISDSDVEGKRLDGEQILRLIDWAEFLVAHNLSFDRPFVERLYPQAIGKTWLCSKDNVPWRQMGFSSRKLQDLLRDHDIRPETAHRGAHDVRATLQLLSCTDKNGTYYFKHMLDCLEGRASVAARAADKRAPVARAKAGSAAKTVEATGRRGKPLGLIGRILRLVGRRDK